MITTPQNRGDFESRVMAMKGEFSRNDFPDLHHTQSTNGLIRMHRTGKIVRVRKATIGRYGEPAVYRVKKGKQ